MADYYDILEVPRDASEDLLKKAYRKMAVRWHPDKNPADKDAATERFKQISQAYQVLNDPQQRVVYDQCGHAGLSSAGGEGGGSGSCSDPHDTFRSFFEQMSADNSEGGVHFVFGDGQTRMRFGPGPPRQLFYELPLTLEDIFKGGRKRLHTRNVDVPPAVDDGAQLKSIDGQAVFIVRERQHPRFYRRRLDLIHHAALSFLDFWCGCFYEVDSIDGKKVRVQFKARSFQPIVKSDLGLRHASSPGRGSLVICPCLLHPRLIEAFKNLARSAFSVILLVICIRNPRLLYIIADVLGHA